MTTTANNNDNTDTINNNGTNNNANNNHNTGTHLSINEFIIKNKQTITPSYLMENTCIFFLRRDNSNSTIDTSSTSSTSSSRSTSNNNNHNDNNNRNNNSNTTTTSNSNHFYLQFGQVAYDYNSNTFNENNKIHLLNPNLKLIIIQKTIYKRTLNLKILYTLKFKKNNLQCCF